ncbi:hypothetical protein ACA910_006428 [Epithemia clementina (nom. ined.)]
MVSFKKDDDAAAGAATKEDVSMTDAAAADATEQQDDEGAAVVVLPPLQAAAWRLDKSLTVGVSSTDSNSNNNNNNNSINLLLLSSYQFSNPAKRVRRWLSTSSGVAADATLVDIRLAAQALLDPNHNLGTGASPILPLLLQPEPEEEDADEEESMKVEPIPADKEEDQNQKTVTFSDDNNYLSANSATEVQAWLLSLKVRLLWRKAQRKSEPEVAHSVLVQAAEQCRTGIAWLTGLVHSRPGGPYTLSSSSSSLFPLLARLWRYYVLIVTSAKKDALSSSSSVARMTLRSELAHAHNAALLRRDMDTSATLLNCMLQELLQHSQVEQAQKLLSNSSFPSLMDGTSGGTTSSTGGGGSSYNNNNQLCRYLYYSGRIQALRLDYTNAYANLTQSLRKAPTNTALGFRIAVQRLLIVVQLLMGEIPERHVFYFTKTITTAVKPDESPKKEGDGSSSSTTTTTTTVTRRQQLGELEPYLHITQAVRRGDLAVFTKVVSQHKARLQADETFTLISRLAHQVVKAGLRKLQTCYSRLSLHDVAQRLGLANAQQAELVVAKAVRDGVLDATIHHAEQYIQSHDLQNVYATKEPAQALHRRIAYCLTTHNDAVRAMRYPPDAYKKQLEASRSGSARGRRKGDDDKTDEEKAQELEDELDEDY